MADSPRQGYRRSWKNLLINKGYQLRFTLFMVGLSALLMVVLGLWVMRKADTATQVSINDVLGHDCPEIPAFVPAVGVPANNIERMDEPAEPSHTEARPAAAEAVPDRAAAAQVDEAAASETGTAVGNAAQSQVQPQPQAQVDTGATAEPASASEPGERRRVTVEVGDLHLGPEQPASVPSEFVKSVIDRYQCRLDQVARISDLKNGYLRILYVLIAVGLLLTVGLTIYGIKMTHRVAGPLHKVSLYLDKVRDGRYGHVHDLRKGDHLIEFYNSFKAAHAGLRTMEEQDIAVLREVLQVAEREDLGSRSPEIAALLSEMRTTLERKEKSLE